MQKTVATFKNIRKLNIQENCFIEEARLNATITKMCKSLQELNGERLAQAKRIGESSRIRTKLISGPVCEGIFKMKYLKIPSNDFSGTNLSETGRSMENNKFPSENIEENKQKQAKVSNNARTSRIR